MVSSGFFVHCIHLSAFFCINIHYINNNSLLTRIIFGRAGIPDPIFCCRCDWSLWPFAPHIYIWLNHIASMKNCFENFTGNTKNLSINLGGNWQIYDTELSLSMYMVWLSIYLGLLWCLLANVILFFIRDCYIAFSFIPMIHFSCPCM